MSQYFTINDLGDGTPKYQSMNVTATASSSNVITARRIMISHNGQTNGGVVTLFADFGENPTATLTTFVVPPGTTVFNFQPGWKVSLRSNSTSILHVSVVDLD